MRAVAEKNAESFVFRLRRQDTPTGVSNVTVQRLTELTGLTRTKVVHLALKEMANKYIPCYEMDDGALTDQEMDLIRKISSATDIPAEDFDVRLF